MALLQDFNSCDRPTDGRTDLRTDGRTDGRTDTPSYRDARTHLKKGKKSIERCLSKLLTQFTINTNMYWRNDESETSGNQEFPLLLSCSPGFHFGQNRFAIVVLFILNVAYRISQCAAGQFDERARARASKQSGPPTGSWGPRYNFLLRSLLSPPPSSLFDDS